MNSDIILLKMWYGSTAYDPSSICFRYFSQKSTFKSNNLLSVSAILRAALLGLNRFAVTQYVSECKKVEM